MIARGLTPPRNMEMEPVLPGAASDAICGFPAAMSNVRAIGFRSPPCVMRDVPGQDHDAVARCIRRCLFELLAARGRGRSVCPSEVAQTAASGRGRRWQDLMPGVHAVARTLAEAGVIEAIQHEVVVDPALVRGPIRLRFARAFNEAVREPSSVMGSGGHDTTSGRGHEGEYA